jgi:hypothetical protein
MSYTRKLVDGVGNSQRGISYSEERVLEECGAGNILIVRFDQVIVVRSLHRASLLNICLWRAGALGLLFLTAISALVHGLSQVRCCLSHRKVQLTPIFHWRQGRQ